MRFSCGFRFRFWSGHPSVQSDDILYWELLRFHNRSLLEGYIRYFYEEEELDSLLNLLPEKQIIFLDEPLRIEEHAEAVELEFRESMSHRAEKGYILPGQMDVLYSRDRIGAILAKKNFVTLSALHLKKTFHSIQKSIVDGYILLLLERRTN